MGGVVNAPKYGEGVRSGSRLNVLPHTGAEPAARDATLGRWVQPNPNAPDRGDALSEREELIRLRTAIAGLTKECDVLESSATLLIQKAMQR
jgi:hypothetical protein